MSGVWCWGFDEDIGSASPESYLPGAFSTSGTGFSRVAGRGGVGYALSLTTTARITRALGFNTEPTGTDGVIVGFAFKINTLPGANSAFASFNGSGSAYVNLILSTGGALSMNRSSNQLDTTGSNIWTGPSTISAGIWYYLELQLNGMTNSGGYARGWLNGAAGTDNSGGDTNGAVSDQVCASFSIGTEDFASTRIVSVDDFYMVNDEADTKTTIYPLSKVYERSTVANATPQVWTTFGSGTAAYDRIGEAVPNATGSTPSNGIDSSSNGDESFFQVASFGLGASDSVAFVSVHGFAVDSVGANVQHGTATGGTRQYKGVNEGVGTSLAWSSATFDANAAAAAWTASNVDSERYGIKNTS